MREKSGNFGEKLNKIAWRKPKTKRKKRRRTVSKKILLIGVIFLLSAGLAGGIFFSPVFKIQKLLIFGDTVIARKNIESFVYSTFGRDPFLSTIYGNLLIFDTARLEKEMKAEFPKLGEVKIKKDFFQKALLISVEEKKLTGIWCIDPEPCFYLDERGVIFEEAPNTEGALILLVKERQGQSPQGSSISSSTKDIIPDVKIPKLGEGVIDQDLLNFIINLKEIMTSVDNLNVGIREFSVRRSNPDVEAMTTQGFKIYFDSQKKPEDQAANLEILLTGKLAENRQKIEYIDLREGNRIYYKLREE